MDELLKAKLREDGAFGDSKEITNIEPVIKDNEQHYTVTVRNWNNDAEQKYTYANGELLEFMFDQVSDLKREIESNQ